MLTADLYFSFRSPYSYLATARYRDLVREYDLTIVLRPVYPIAVRNPGFFDSANPLWVPYLLADVVRVAEFNAMPFRWPRPDPIATDRETRRILPDQPHIHRLTWLGVLAAHRGKGLEFAFEVAHFLWGEGVENWHEPEKLAIPVRRAGLDLPELLAEMEGKTDDLHAEVLANQTAEETAGHWGTPCLVFDGEPFFGQDRIDMALWRMQQKGLKRR